MGIAAHNFHDSMKHLPRHGDQTTGLSSQALLLPYMENQDVLNLVNPKIHWRAQTLQTKRTPLPFLKCPSQNPMEFTDVLASATSPPWGEDSPLRCHYAAIYGAKPGDCGRGGSIDGLEYPENTYTIVNCDMSPQSDGGMATNGVLFYESDIAFKDITDGSSKTMMYGELSWDAGINMTWLAADDIGGAFVWVFNGKNIMNPINSAAFTPTWEEHDAGLGTVPIHDVSLGSKHPGGCHVLMADGSANFLSETVELAVYKAMASRRSDEVYQSPF
jgi:prepilin-type processing-associated H-X9-DG protein